MNRKLQHAAVTASKKIQGVYLFATNTYRGYVAIIHYINLQLRLTFVNQLPYIIKQITIQLWTILTPGTGGGSFL